MSLTPFLYRLAIALWLGGASLFTFVLTPLLFKTESRDTAGRIVGTLFPGYFRWGLACGAVALLCAVFRPGGRSLAVLLILVAMLSLTAYQAFVIEPRAAHLKQQIGSFEQTSPEDPLRRQFSRLHGISAGCNLLTIGGGVALLALL